MSFLWPELLRDTVSHRSPESDLIISESPAQHNGWTRHSQFVKWMIQITIQQTAQHENSLYLDQ